MTKEPEEVNLQDLLQSLADEETENAEYIPSTDIELTHEVVGQLFDETQIKMISDLSEPEIKGILKISLLNKILFAGQKTILTELIENLLTLKVSKNRLGRSELIQAISNTREEEDGSIKGRFKRFLG